MTQTHDTLPYHLSFILVVVVNKTLMIDKRQV